MSIYKFMKLKLLAAHVVPQGEDLQSAIDAAYEVFSFSECLRAERLVRKYFVKRF